MLYYNLSSSGLQTVSVLRCDWEGEVVVMECTQNGNWKSINQQLDMCSKDKEVSLRGNTFCSVLNNGLFNKYDRLHHNVEVGMGFTQPRPKPKDSVNSILTERRG